MGTTHCLILFTKPAAPGRVKTRMMPTLSARQAAELHQAFLDDLLPRLERGSFDLEIAWAVDDGGPLPGARVTSFRQRGADLGERLFHGLSLAAQRYEIVAAIGSDHPEIELERVEAAFAALDDGAGVVLGPTADGGYYLIGAHRDALDARLFEDVPWSTPEVLEATVERCRECGIEPVLLPPGHDIDSPDDLERLARQITLGSTACPRVETLLRSWGRLG